jgi:hypothetical protein
MRDLIETMIEQKIRRDIPHPPDNIPHRYLTNPFSVPDIVRNLCRTEIYNALIKELGMFDRSQYSKLHGREQDSFLMQKVPNYKAIIEKILAS